MGTVWGECGGVMGRVWRGSGWWWGRRGDGESVAGIGVVVGAAG